MKFNILVLTIASVLVMLTACDDTTDTLGTSLTDDMDMLEVSTDTFEVTSCSFVADSVLSRNTIGYLGKIRDPETGNYIKGDFMAQFGTLENYYLPQKDSIVSVDENGDDVLVVSKEEFEAMYENLKASNPDMAQIALEDLEYFINSQYEVVPETITEEWIKEHITTEMNIIYNENDSITFSNVGSVLDAENVIFESKDILDEKFT